MSNGLTRLATRFLGEPQALEAAHKAIGEKLDAERAAELGLVTFALDDIDWNDEIRVFLEERASFSPDGLTGLEANWRFGGPETMETKSLPGSLPGRTGSSSAPTLWAKRARCGATAPAKRPCSTPSEF